MQTAFTFYLIQIRLKANLLLVLPVQCIPLARSKDIRYLRMQGYILTLFSGVNFWVTRSGPGGAGWTATNTQMLCMPVSAMGRLYWRNLESKMLSAGTIPERFLNCEPRFLHRNWFIYCIKTPEELETGLERNRLSTSPAAGWHLKLKFSSWISTISRLPSCLVCFLLQWSAVTVTPSGICKSVTVIDCHSNSSFPRALKWPIFEQNSSTFDWYMNQNAKSSFYLALLECGCTN